MFDGYFEQMTMQPEGERSLRAGFRQVPIRKRLQDQFDQCEDAQKPHGAEPASRCLRQLVRSFRSMRITVTDLRQRLKGATRRRQVLEEGPATPTPRLLLGRTPTKLYSPFGIDSPCRPAPF
ncbi:hypothetical protein HUJ04_000094 [Dendroctonus ponderosae]|nr:hypothetical protein HUJ04_000094 [Dendroctonus ponderosae]KAH1003309.1 hypothetical protein HUJ05_011237 [Dendroctonus ponderosae]